jgi:hypothetical protein
MHKDERDLLEVLKFELEFLDKGGYGRSPREPWRPQFIFEDSPTCMNYDSKEQPSPCGECVLMQLVPPAFREAKIPCRHIPFNAGGEDLDSMYRWGDQDEIEETLGNWLRRTIANLEQARSVAPLDAGNIAAPVGATTKGTPLHEKIHPKCANPACPIAFHWLGGGKFFRFRPNVVSENSGHAGADLPTNEHGVKHFWLCERCSQIFTLMYEAESGVVLKLQRQELPLDENPKELPATCRI